MTVAGIPVGDSPAHGIGGWELADFEFDEISGEGKFLYEHPTLGERVAYRDQYVSREYHERIAAERRRRDTAVE